MKKLFICLLMIIGVLFITGCGDSFTKKEQEDFKNEILNEISVDKTFQNGGIFVTLNTNFKEYEVTGWDIYLYDGESALMSQRVSKQSNINDMDFSSLNLKQYMQLVQSLNKMEAYVYEDKTIYGESLLYCYCKKPEGTVDYGYMMMALESKGYFYTINLSCPYEKFEDYKPLFLRYAKGISVK